MGHDPNSDRSRAALAAFGVVALAVLVSLSAGTGGHRGSARRTAAAEPAAADLPGFVLQAPAVDEGPLRYDREYPTIPYSSGARTDAALDRSPSRSVEAVPRAGRAGGLERR